MEPPCYLWSTRSQGWMNKTGNYSTDITQAKQLGLSEALALVKKHRTEAGHNMIPVRVGDMS